MSKIGIFVATHKVYDKIKKTDGYIPMFVGAALHKNETGYQGDDTGENISIENPQYCELTAMYWAWRNPQDFDIMGLCHYRRYFVKNYYTKGLIEEEILTSKDIDNILHNYKIIMPQLEYKSACNGILYEDKKKREPDFPLTITEKVIKENCPEFISSFKKFAYGKKVSFGNMFITSSEKFNEYCNWIFPLLKKIEEEHRKVKELEPRMLAFLAEYLLCTWVDYVFTEKEIYYLKVANIEERMNWKNKVKIFLEKTHLTDVVYKIYYLIKRY